VLRAILLVGSGYAQPLRSGGKNDREAKKDYVEYDDAKRAHVHRDSSRGLAGGERTGRRHDVYVLRRKLERTFVRCAIRKCSEVLNEALMSREESAAPAKAAP